MSEMSDPFSDESTPMSSGDDIDAGIGNDSGDGASFGPQEAPSPRTRKSRLRAVKDEPNWEKGSRDASSKAPTLDEWTNFFGRIVLKTATSWYLSYAFRGIDEELLTDREIERLAMSDDERKLIATPLAELSNRSKFMKKHGRTIVASGDSFQAMVVLGAWMSRVNRIASKYRPKNPTVRVNGVTQNGSSGQGTPEANGTEAFTSGATGGHVPNGFPVYRGSSG